MEHEGEWKKELLAELARTPKKSVKLLNEKV